MRSDPRRAMTNTDVRVRESGGSSGYRLRVQVTGMKDYRKICNMSRQLSVLMNPTNMIKANFFWDG